MNEQAEVAWKRFIDHLEVAMPSGMGVHKNFLGSIEKYHKVFTEANKLPSASENMHGDFSSWDPLT